MTITVTNGGVLDVFQMNNFVNGTIDGNGMISTSEVFNLGTVAGSDGSGMDGSGGVGTLTIDGNYRQVGPPPNGSIDQ